MRYVILAWTALCVAGFLLLAIPVRVDEDYCDTFCFDGAVIFLALVAIFLVWIVGVWLMYEAVRLWRRAKSRPQRTKSRLRDPSDLP